MFTKIISYLVIFSVLFADAASCGKNGSIRSRAISDPEEPRRSLPLKEESNRARSKSLSDFSPLSKRDGLAINSEHSFSKIVPLGCGIDSSGEILSKEALIKTTVKEPEDCSKSFSLTSLTISSSSTNSSPRGDSSKDSRGSSPTKSSESLSLEGQDSPRVFDKAEIYPQGYVSLEKKEPIPQKNLTPPLKESLKKFETKIESPQASILEEKQPTEDKIIYEGIQTTVPSEKLTILSENDPSESHSISPSTSISLSVSDGSSQEKERTSTSRRNSTDSSGDVEDSTCIKPISAQDVLGGVISEVTVNNKPVDSSLSLPTISLGEVDNTEPVFSQKFLEDGGEKQESAVPEAIVQSLQEKAQVLPKPDKNEENENKDIIIQINDENDANTAIPTRKISFFEKVRQLNQKNKDYAASDAEKRKTDGGKSTGEFGSLFNNKKQKNSGSEADGENEGGDASSKTKRWTESENEDLRFKDEDGKRAPLDRLKSVEFTIVKYGLSSSTSEDGSSSSSSEDSDFDIWFTQDKKASHLNIQFSGDEDPWELLNPAREKGLVKEAKKPLQKLVPDEFKGPYIPRGGEDGSRDSVISLGELEPLNQMSMSKPPSKFSQMLNILPEDEAKISCFKKIPWLTLAAFTISAGEAIAMVPVYNGGLVYLRDVHDSSIIWLYFKSKLGESAWAYFVPSIFLDACPRNLKSLNRAAAYLSGEKVDKTRIALTLVASVLPSILEASYLIVFEEYLMHRMHIRGWDNQFAITATVFSLCRFTDTMISNCSALWELQDDFKEWIKTSSFSLAKGLRPYFIHSSLVSDREDLIALHQSRLENLSQSLFRRSQEEINEVYTSIRDVKTTLQKEIPELEEDLLDSAQDFFVRRYLLALGEEKVTIGQKNPASWRETIGIGTVLTLGSPYRFLAMEFIWETALGLVLPPLASKILGWVFGSFAFVIQTALEGKAMKKYSDDFLRDEGPEGHWSHFKFRAFLKSICSFQGCVFALPLTVLCLQICDLWFSSNWGMLPSPFFIFPEYALLTNSFNNSYNKQAGSFALDWYNQNVLEKRLGKGLEHDYKVDYIWRRINKEKNRLKTLPTFDLDMLQKTLNSPEQEGVINI